MGWALQNSSKSFVCSEQTESNSCVKVIDQRNESFSTLIWRPAAAAAWDAKAAAWDARTAAWDTCVEQ